MKLQKSPVRASVAVTLPTPVVTDPACPICQEEVGRKSPEGVKESWALTPCGHAFGSVCIKRYLAITDKPLCPVCRQDVFHYCSHPVLPASYDLARGTTRTSYPWDGDPRNSLCPYCVAGKNKPRRAEAVVGVGEGGGGGAGAGGGPNTTKPEPEQEPEIDSDAEEEIQEEEEEEDNGELLAPTSRDLPPVPGAYGRWELASQEPDWKFLKWFDAQEPKTNASADITK